MVYQQPLAMFSLNPVFVGQQPKAVLGKKSGYASVTTKMKELGLDYPEDKEKFELVLAKSQGAWSIQERTGNGRGV